MISYGLSQFDIAVALVSTDNQRGRTCRPDDSRPYQTRAGFTAKDMDKLFESFGSMSIDPVTPRILVVDGGGNRPKFDELLTQVTDLAILPFMDGPEDIDVVRADLEAYPNAYALPSRWPASMFTHAQVSAILEDLHQRFPGRILRPVPMIRASQTLVREVVGPVDTKLRTVCKELAIEIMVQLGFNVFELPR